VPGSARYNVGHEVEAKLAEAKEISRTKIEKDARHRYTLEITHSGSPGSKVKILGVVAC